MIIAFFVFLGIILSLIDSKSKYTYSYLIILLWLIGSFTYGNADEGVYLSRYNNVEMWKGDTELLYYQLIRFCNKINLSFFQFKMLSTAIQLSLISSTILKYSKRPNLVILFYFIFPFMMNVAQMRDALAMSVFIFGARFLIDDKNQNTLVEDKKITSNDLKYIACIIIAAFIHTSAIYWLLLLLAKKFNEKKVIVLTIIISLLIAFVNPTTIGNFLSAFGTSTRIKAYTTEAYLETRLLHMNIALFRSAMFTIINFIFIYYLSTQEKINSEILFLLKSNTILITVLPLIYFYTPEMYRSQVDTSLLIYIIGFNRLSDARDGRNNLTIPLNNFIIAFSLITLSLFNMYFYIVRGNYESVFYPIFNNNLFFNSLLE